MCCVSTTKWPKVVLLSFQRKRRVAKRRRKQRTARLTSEFLSSNVFFSFPFFFSNGLYWVMIKARSGYTLDPLPSHTAYIYCTHIGSCCPPLLSIVLKWSIEFGQRPRSATMCVNVLFVSRKKREDKIRTGVCGTPGTRSFYRRTTLIHYG